MAHKDTPRRHPGCKPNTRKEISQTKKTLVRNRKRKSTAEFLNLGVMLLLLVIVTFLFYDIMKTFILPLTLSAVFTTLFYPLYKRLNSIIGGHNGITALIFCFLIILVIFIPLYFLGAQVVQQAIDFYNAANTFIRTTITDQDFQLFKDIKESPYLEWLDIDSFLADIEWKKTLSTVLSSSGKIASIIANKTYTSIFSTGFMLFIIIYSMFFFFKDGKAIVSRIRYLSPLRDSYEEELIKKFGSISRATIRGTLVIGVIQGICGTITFIIFGIPGWILWGVVMTVLSIIPVVGIFIVMIPVAIYKLLMGKIAAGIIIIFVAIIINYAVDYLLRPGLVGKQSKMHDLLIFLSTLGGLTAFGIMGFIIGPLIAMFFITLLDIYGMEFKDLLH